MVIFEMQLRKQGASFVFSVPPELVTHMKANEGDTLQCRDEEGKKGPYFSVWKKKA